MRPQKYDFDFMGKKFEIFGNILEYYMRKNGLGNILNFMGKKFEFFRNDFNYFQIKITQV